MKRAICTAMVVLGVLVVSPGPATAQTTLSPGCQALNSPLLDATYAHRDVSGQLFAGEIITVTGVPTDRPGGSVLLFIATTTLEAPAPGPVSYTVPAPMTVVVQWTYSLGTAAWTVSCTAAPTYPPPLAVSATQRITEVTAPPLALTSDGSSGFPLATVAILAGVVLLCAEGWLGARRRRKAAPEASSS